MDKLVRLHEWKERFRKMALEILQSIKWQGQTDWTQSPWNTGRIRYLRIEYLNSEHMAEEAKKPLW